MSSNYQTAKTLAAASATNIAASQSPGAGVITLNGSAVVNGVAVLDTQRRVLITTGGNDSGITYTIFGTNDAGMPISETIPGPNATTGATTLDFKTVTSVTHTGSVAGTVTVGTNGVGSTPWWMTDTDGVIPMNFGIGVTVSGTINYDVEYTYDDPNEPFSGPVVVVDQYGRSIRGVTVWDIAAFTAQTGNKDGSVLSPVKAFRLTVNSGTGEARMIITPAGLPLR